MNEPLVSVVTLSYRKYEYIYQCIDSVFKQNYSNIEYIISDDGADNFPRKEIEEYISKNRTISIRKIKIICGRENLGTVKNANKAFDCATGEYIIPLSCDDVFFDENVVGNIVRSFQRTGADVIGTTRLLSTEKLIPIRRMPMQYYHRRIYSMKSAKEQFLAMITDQYYEMVSGAVTNYRANFWKKIKFDEAYTLWEDGPFFTKIMQSGVRVYFDFDIISIFYRAGGVSTNQSIHPKLLADSEKYRERYCIEKLKDFSSYPFFYRRLKRCQEFSPRFCGRWLTKFLKILFFPDVVVYKIKKLIDLKFALKLEEKFVSKIYYK